MIAAPSGSKGSAFCTVKSMPFTLMLNMFLVQFFGDLAQRRIFRHTGIGKQDIKPTFSCLIGRKAVEIAELGHVPWGRYVFPISLTAVSSSVARRPVMKTYAPSGQTPSRSQVRCRCCRR